MTRKRTFEGIGATRFQPSDASKGRRRADRNSDASGSQALGAEDISSKDYNVGSSAGASGAGTSRTSHMPSSINFCSRGSPAVRYKKQSIGQAAYQQKRKRQG